MGEQNLTIFTGGELKRFACSRGHTWEGREVLKVAFSDETFSVEITTCIRCLAEVLEKFVQVDEVLVEEKKGVAD